MERHRHRLAEEFRRRGVLTAREAADALGVSQPTVSRTLAGLRADQLLRIGRGRATRYAVRRAVRGSGSTWPLYEIETGGRAGLVGYIHALEGGAWFLEQQEPWDSLRGSEFDDGLYPGLPWFLQDLRPQGFLGRSFAHRYASELGAPRDPRRWDDDDVALSMVRFGHDLPGSFVLGGDAFAAAQATTDGEVAVGLDGRAAIYSNNADAALAGEWPGSSAAGEQPKFTATIVGADDSVEHTIVKFSGAGGRPEDGRWADLLAAEHVANSVLRDDGIPCAKTNVVDFRGRRFLESVRFDRLGRRGRRGLVSLEALDAAFFGDIDTPWPAAAARLLSDGWISDEDAERLSLLWWFGGLIGNTDMHYGNVSLFLRSERPLELAPTYDMVPMMYRPDVEGMLPLAPLTASPPLPEVLPLWGRAAALAERFWSRMSSSNQISASFRDVAAANAEEVSQCRTRFAD